MLVSATYSSFVLLSLFVGADYLEQVIHGPAGVLGAG